MPAAARGRLSPWIERLILSYGETQDGGAGGGAGGGGRLKAHVIGVGQIPASQVPGEDGPGGLLFLSDGAVQIPAVLTAAAWERLQEQEERESLASLLHATVCLQEPRLLFHMDAERTRCRFYLSLGELATTAAGPARHSPPCCTSLPAVQERIGGAWRAGLGEESQRSQWSQDLSELLGAWQHDCLQAVLDGVRQQLAAASERPDVTPPSACSTPPPSSYRLTGWDVERTRDKMEDGFSVPVGLLLLPEDGQAGGVLPSLDQAERRIPEPPAVPMVGGASEMMAGSLEMMGGASETVGGASEEQHPAWPEETAPVAGSIGGSLSNPWDMFPPPSVTHSSPDTTPPPSTDATTAASKPGGGGAAAHSFLPPYQELGAGAASSCVGQSASGGQQGAPETPCRKRKQRQDSDDAAAAALQEGEGPSESPPSWLFNSQAATSGSAPSDDSSPSQATVGDARGVHGDGTPFSYSYPPSGRDLQDLSRLGVAAPLLQWAVRYLLAPERPATGQKLRPL